MSHLEAPGEKPKNKCKRCNGTGQIKTWYDTSETRKVISKCPMCKVEIDLNKLREVGL